VSRLNDAFAKKFAMATQKFCPTRFGGFSGRKAYIEYVKGLKNRRNAKGDVFATPSGFIVKSRRFHKILFLVDFIKKGICN